MPQIYTTSNTLHCKKEIWIKNSIKGHTILQKTSSQTNMDKYSFFNLHVAIYETQQNCINYFLIYLLLCVLFGLSRIPI